MTEVDAQPTTAKQASLTISAAKRANALRNAERFAWAAAERDAAIQAAEKWLALSDDALWELIPGQELPRSVHIYDVYGTSKTPLCPHCKTGIIPYGNYPWQMDVFKRPWKIECPNCHEIYPKNDFGAYYRTALDEQGVFRRGKGDPKLLFNTEHPDPNDPLHTYGVDDGYGWKDSDGQRWDFIAVYAQWGLWKEVRQGITALARAYTLTNRPEYAHKCGVMLARLADLYPEMDFYPLHQLSFAHSHGGTGRGRVEGCIWECGNGVNWALAYDWIFDALRMDEALARFVGEKHAREKRNPIHSPGELAAHIERNLLEEIIIGVKDGRLRGNQGMHQSAIVAAALALDRPEETPRLIDWAFAPGTRRPDPAHPGREIVTGGDLANVLVDIMDRDGLGNEGAPGYCLWGANMQAVADLLEDNPKYKAHSLYRDYPKLHQYYRVALRWACLDAATPPIGDSGGVGAWGVVSPPASAVLRAFQIYREPDLARLAWRLVGEKPEAIHGSIYEEDPDALRKEVLAAVQGPPPPLESQLLDGFGLAILQTPYREHGRAVWLYFGRNTGHGHHDRLNLGLYAENVDMLPDLGYPEYASGRPRDLAWTRNNASHNVPIVDGRAQLPSYTGRVRAFEPEGKVRLVDVSSDDIYPGTTTVRRTVWMVDVNERYSYVVDIVRLRGGNTHTLGWHGLSGKVTSNGLRLKPQGRGTFAGEDVEPEELAPGWQQRAGYSFLYNVERDAQPPRTFWVDYLVEDKRGRIAAGREPHLRLHNLTALQEVAFADGDPQRNRPDAPRPLKFVMLTRRGQALESVFVTVLEPYDREPFLHSVRLLPATFSTPGAHPVAVEVMTKDGRTDYLLSLETPGKATVGDIRVDGTNAFVARRGGRIEIAKLMRGRELVTRGLHLTVDAPAYTGTLQAVLPDNPNDQRLRLSAPLPKGANCKGRVILVANDAVQDAAYIIEGQPEPQAISLGSISLVRGFRDRSDHSKGTVTNVRPGERYEIPTFAYVEHPGSEKEVRLANANVQVRSHPQAAPARSDAKRP